MAQLSINQRQAGDVAILDLNGEVRIGDSATALRGAIRELVAAGNKKILLNLAGVRYIDSSGIGAVVDALRQAKKVGGDAKLVNPSPFAAKTFKMVGILSLFKVYDSEAEAVQACAA